MHTRARIAIAICFCTVTATYCHAANPLAGSPFLTNMPQNSNKRCVGIASVAEALLAGECVDSLKTSVDALAGEIYSTFTSGKSIRYPAHLILNGKRLPIDDKSVLAELSIQVANLYKSDYHRLVRSPAGTDKLLAAQDSVVRTTDELTQLLRDDRDNIGFFCCFGQRVFPGGKLSDTSHAVLIQAMPNEVFLVYDPNDPGTAIKSRLDVTPRGLLLTWQCQYRDQNVMTTQSYTIVPQARFFRALQ